ncbi:MAG: hypothetical protein AAFU54_29335 [Chloroflexota bacterium]
MADNSISAIPVSYIEGVYPTIVWKANRSNQMHTPPEKRFLHGGAAIAVQLAALFSPCRHALAQR